MKAYTDIEQSKKLAKILPLESADMVYIWHATSNNPTFRFDDDMPPMVLKNVPIDKITVDTLPCWSLAALFNVLPEGIIEKYYAPNLQKEDGKYSIAYGNDELLCVADNPIDACVEMIIKLHMRNSEFSSYEDYVKYLKEKGFAFEVTENNPYKNLL